MGSVWLTVVKMQLVLALSVLVSVTLGGSEYREFHKWAKNKAFESCFGEENMKVWTVQMKKAVAKCSQQDAPELLLPQFRAPYKTVNALLEASDEMENSDMHMMFKMFKFMHMMQENNHHNNQYNQFRSGSYRPYSNNYEVEKDDMPMPMKWMMKMMMKNMMHKNMDYDMYDNKHIDEMEMRSDPRKEKLGALMKMFQMNKQDHQMPLFKYDKHSMFNKYDLRNDDMDFGNMFRNRQARAVQNNLDLGDRLVEKLQSQKEEMQEKVGNLSCILQELSYLDNNNKLTIFGMKKDLAQYNLPSQWFKENYENLLDTCYEMATTLPAEIDNEYIVEGEFGTINMAQVKMFMNCCHKGKGKLCMNNDIKKKIEANFGPLDDILNQSGLTENQLFPLVQNLLHGQESELDDLF